MPFTGKASYSAGDTLPEIMEDVSDLVSLVSPFETPLLDRLGDATRPALSTVHEWIEDSLLPNFDLINQTVFNPNPTDATQITVVNASRFQVGDLLRPANATEVLHVTAIAGSVITVIRRYGGTPASALANGMRLTILGNAALEGTDALPPRFTNRSRKVNYTQIFTSTVEVSGTLAALPPHGVQEELEYQKQQRLRELLRDLENSVINGTAPASGQTGGASTRRSMNGLIRTIQANQFVPGQNGFPAGGGSGSELNESVLNAALRFTWENSSARIDTIVAGGVQKRRINQLIGSARQYAPDDERVRDLVSIYETDFGVCRVVLSRWMPADTVLFLDSSRISVMPLRGRSFGYQRLAPTGDRESGMCVGEYTLEVRNESAHALVRGLSTT